MTKYVKMTPMQIYHAQECLNYMKPGTTTTITLYGNGTIYIYCNKNN